VIKVDHPELTLAEMLRPPSGKGTPLHFHKMHSDGFYVLEGTLTVTVDDEDRELSAGISCSSRPASSISGGLGNDDHVLDGRAGA
jgi:mannose-6-phosphate isomerase-like protein (cupin superfamily)